MGPVFTRELVTAPRRKRFFIVRAAYAGALLVLLSTAWQVLTGMQIVRGVGDLARFGAVVFQVLAPLQLVLAVFLSGVWAAASVAHEKDRRTIMLLLLSHLSNVELVLGKLMASLLAILTLLVTALPVFALIALFGGVSFEQIGRTSAVTLGAVLVAGSLGSTIALWREKTFQALSLTTSILVLWTVLCEALARGLVDLSWTGLSAEQWAAMLSPWHAMLVAVRPRLENVADHDVVLGFGISAVVATAVLNGWAIWRVRAWNSTAERATAIKPADKNADTPSPAARATTATTARTRAMWDNPILWREVRTWAYGRRTLLVRLGYLSLFAAAAWSIHTTLATAGSVGRWDLAGTLIPLSLVSLLVINMQSVTSLTSERDTAALDLLLVTDLTAREFVFGKLAGVFYNTKEMVLLPAALACYIAIAGRMSAENLTYALGAWLVLAVFAATLGLHVGLAYVNTRVAIGVSLGTLFFLVVGIATTMRIMFAFSGSFGFQLQPFLVAMLGGGVGLYAALGARNPSPAILATAFLCPIATFYALTSFMLDYTLAVFLVVTATYGFATAAMLVPDLHEFDVATGRTTSGE